MIDQSLEHPQKKYTKISVILGILFGISATLFFISIVALRILLPLSEECSSQNCKIAFLIVCIIGGICIFLFISLLIILSIRKECNIKHEYEDIDYNKTSYLYGHLTTTKQTDILTKGISSE